MYVESIINKVIISVNLFVRCVYVECVRAHYFNDKCMNLCESSPVRSSKRELRLRFMLSSALLTIIFAPYFSSTTQVPLAARRSGHGC